jgi:hypothetical protein
MKASGVLLGVAALLVLGGCGSQRQASALSATRQFYTALARGDGAAACARLAPDTRHELEQSAHGQDCAQAIVGERLPDPGPVRSVAVYGDQALMRLSGDSVFLAAFSAGWRVVAAGCRSRGEDRPYDCLLAGG